MFDWKLIREIKRKLKTFIPIKGLDNAFNLIPHLLKSDKYSFM